MTMTMTMCMHEHPVQCTFVLVLPFILVSTPQAVEGASNSLRVIRYGIQLVNG